VVVHMDKRLCYWNLCLTKHPILFSSTTTNASRNSNLNKTNLIVSEARVDGGTTLKRFQPRAQGHSYPIHKFTCHITIMVENG
jgi:large subunit ribosomal protein L22